jgi:hypothetical protein
MHVCLMMQHCLTVMPVPEIIDPVFAKTSRKRSFSMTENERFGLVLSNPGSINSGTVRKAYVHHGLTVLHLLLFCVLSAVAILLYI